MNPILQQKQFSHFILFMQEILAAGFVLHYEALTSAVQSGKFTLQYRPCVHLQLCANKYNVSIYKVYVKLALS